MLFLLTHMPITPQVASAAGNWDKLFHGGSYLGLAVLAALATFRPRLRDFPVMPLLLGLIAYAGLDEVLQGPVGRTPDVGDWLADVVGVVVGLLISLWATRALPRLVRWSRQFGIIGRTGKSEIVRH